MRAQGSSQTDFQMQVHLPFLQMQVQLNKNSTRLLTSNGLIRKPDLASQAGTLMLQTLKANDIGVARYGVR